MEESWQDKRGDKNTLKERKKPEERDGGLLRSCSSWKTQERERESVAESLRDIPGMIQWIYSKFTSLYSIINSGFT